MRNQVADYANTFIASFDPFPIARLVRFPRPAAPPPPNCRRAPSVRTLTTVLSTRCIFVYIQIIQTHTHTRVICFRRPLVRIISDNKRTARALSLPADGAAGTTSLPAVVPFPMLPARVAWAHTSLTPRRPGVGAIFCFLIFLNFYKFFF